MHFNNESPILSDFVDPGRPQRRRRIWQLTWGFMGHLRRAKKSESYKKIIMLQGKVQEELFQLHISHNQT